MSKTSFSLCVVSLLALGACTNRPPALRPDPPALDFGSYVGADALVRQGCYSCMKEALAIYERLAESPAFPSARLRAADTAILVAMREREIGLGASNGQTRARDVASRLPVPLDAGPYLAMLDLLPWKGGSVSKERQDELLNAYGTVKANASAWRVLLQRDDDDLLRSSMRVALECSYRSALMEREKQEPWQPPSAAPPLLRFASILCGRRDVGALESLLENNPRFTEIELFLGESAFGQGRLLEAERHILRALAEYPEMAVAAAYLGSIYMAMEDFDEGLVYFDKAVSLISTHREALLGRMKLLSYLGRAEDAIATANRMIELGTWYQGDAYYWRAWNRNRLKDYEAAWADLQDAKKYLPMDGQVAKLTGLIALGRGEVPRAEEEFRTAVRYNDKDGDAWFYLASVLSTRKQWKESADSFATSEPLYVRDEAALRARIREIAASQMLETRKARLTTAKEQQIAATLLQRARSAFSAAAGYFNAGDFAKAQPLAERALAHPDLSESAKKLLDRLPKTD
jgi:tetratricopeptide (TPR) repeat protein